MTTYTYGDIKKRAEKGGYDPNPLGDGEYPCLKVTATNFNDGGGKKKPFFGFRLVAQGGPDHGRSTWFNIWIPDPNHEKADVISAMFLRNMAALGVELHDGVAPAEDAKQAVGNYISATIVTKESGFPNFNKVKKAEAPETTEAPADQPELEFEEEDEGEKVDSAPRPDPVLADDEPF